MPFKKLHSDIKDKLESLDIIAPTPFQSKSIPVIKSGANLFCVAPKGSGKTTTLVLTTLQKIKFQAIGTSPRAFVLVENKESATKMYDAFFEYTRYSSVRVYYAEEKVHIDLHKSEIFEGVDILICTPQTMNKLFLLNGVTATQLKILSIDDAEFLSQKASYAALMAIIPSISKCQFVMYSEKISPTLKRFESHFMEHSRVVSIK